MHKYLRYVLAFMLSIGILAACGGGDDKATEATAGSEPAVAEQSVSLGDATNGSKLYATACVACHGPDAKGVTGLGKDLTTSEWIGQQSDGDLVEFVKKGRDISDPLNTTGVVMPPKGGNPAMSEQEIADIVAYIRTIHQ